MFFPEKKMSFTLRNKMQYSLQSERDVIAETNNDVADITLLSSCMVRNKLSVNDVTHFRWNSRVFMITTIFWFVLLYLNYATALGGLPSTNTEDTLCVERKKLFCLAWFYCVCYITYLILILRRVVYFMIFHMYIKKEVMT